MSTAPLRISCDDCVLVDSPACADCVVTHILSRSADDAVVVAVPELRALRSLEAGGLVPALRHTPPPDEAIHPLPG